MCLVIPILSYPDWVKAFFYEFIIIRFIYLQGELSVGTMASFIGYTFTLTFAVSHVPLWLPFLSIPFFNTDACSDFQVQGLVNSFGDLRRTFAAVERINSVLNEEVDESLAYGLEKEMQQKEFRYKLLFSQDTGENSQVKTQYMAALKSSSNVINRAWSGDICLEGKYLAIPLVFGRKFRCIH